jgi:NADPH:quinone reductase-like Zn-dependent oxidoreductase
MNAAESTDHDTGGVDTLSNTMKAIIQTRFGSPDNVLEFSDVPIPSVASDEVLVRVHAAGVAIGDWLMMTGTPYIARPMHGLFSPKQRVAGLELAGSVEAIGDNVTRFQVGDEVFGWGNGALAEYVAVPEDALALRPANLTPEQAAAVPISGFAALQALRDAGEVAQGQKVLIIGASGAVGTYAVQIAKAFGADVTGVSSTRNVEMVRSIGADHVIDYLQEDITRSGLRYDLIIDLAGNSSLSDLRRTLTPRGTLVIVGGSGGPLTMGFGRTIRAMVLSPFVSHTLRGFMAKSTAEDLAVLAELIETGQVTPVIDATFPIADTTHAMTHIGSRHTQGKTVITV